MGNQNALLSELRRANSLLSLTAHDNRAASKASLIGGSQPEYDEPDLGETWEGSKKNAVQKAIKASLGSGYKPGSLFASIMDCGERDIDLQLRGRQGLATLGIRRADGPGLGFAGKATLGATGINGGYVLANNLVRWLYGKLYSCFHGGVPDGERDQPGGGGRFADWDELPRELVARWQHQCGRLAGGFPVN